jgi:hypothetical protein
VTAGIRLTRLPLFQPSSLPDARRAAISLALLCLLRYYWRAIAEWEADYAEADRAQW